LTLPFAASCHDIPRLNQDHIQRYPVATPTLRLLHSLTTVFNLHVPPDTYIQGSEVHDGNCMIQVHIVGKSIICHSILYSIGIIQSTSIQSPTDNQENVPVYVACFNVSSHVTSVITSSIDCKDCICSFCLNIPWKTNVTLSVSIRSCDISAIGEYTCTNILFLASPDQEINVLDAIVHDRLALS